MVCYDGYLLSHTFMPFEIPDESKVDSFIPPLNPPYALNPDNPANLNTVTLPDVRTNIHGNLCHGYMELRYMLQEGVRDCIDVATNVDNRFKKTFGRGGTPLLESYMCDDASFIAVSMGSLSYHLRDVIDQLRDDAIKVGVIGIHLYRPFPDEAVIKALEGADGIIVFEKAISYGHQGPLCSDIKSAIYNCKNRPFVHNFILGLGGREIKTQDLYNALKNSCTGDPSRDKEPGWIGLKI